MTTTYSKNDDELEGEQIRVSFILAPGVNDPELEVPSDPIAVPASIRRKGLSAIVNHLLDRRVISNEDSDDDDSDEEDDSDDEDKLPAIPFDFLLNKKLLRIGVEAAARREALSLEQAIEIIYFPAQRAPEDSGESEILPDWITSMSYSRQGKNSSRNGILCTGGADGSIRLFEPPNKGDSSDNNNELSLSPLGTVNAHSGPIHCLSTVENQNQLLIASGSMDQTLLTHVTNEEKNKLALHAVYSGGHFSSISSVTFSSNNDTIRMASGDWNGGFCLWNVPSSNTDNGEDGMEKNKHESKKKKRHKGETTSSSSTLTSVKEVQPIVSFKAHSSNISGIVWDYASSGTTSTNDTAKRVITSSWDHSIKVWDVDRQDSLLTLNGSKVVTSLGRCHNSDVVATGHPDCSIRLWDMRTDRSANTSSAVSDSTLKPR